MRRAIEHATAGDWPNSELVDQVILDYDARHRRRYRIQTVVGEEILLNLREAVAMGDGDGLQLDDGKWLYVKAGDENLLEVTAQNSDHLARLAWHLGNRHLPAAISMNRILIRPDHVIETMLTKLHARVQPVVEPFQPEFGAYHEHKGAHPSTKL